MSIATSVKREANVTDKTKTVTPIITIISYQQQKIQVKEFQRRDTEQKTQYTL